MRSLLFAASVLVCLSLFVSGIYVDEIEPVAKKLGPEDTITLGRAGPGQTLVIVAGRGTDGGTCPNNYCPDGWDSLVPVSVPPGWESEASPLNENPMKAKIKVSPVAPDGEYNLTLMAVDEGNYNGLGNMTFHAVVLVSTDVFTIAAMPARVETGVGQPAVFYVTITNTGVASDPFEISVRERDLPAWRFKKQVLVNYGSERVVPYEVVLNEEDQRMFMLEVSSLSSPLIHKEILLAVDSKSGIINDWKATTHGLVVFPIFLEPLYAAMGLVGNLF